MKRHRYISSSSLIFLILLTLLTMFDGKAQHFSYARVTAIYNKNPADVDSVDVVSSDFSISDTVVYIQNKGAGIYDHINSPGNPGGFWGEPDFLNNTRTGVYTILLVSKVENEGRRIIFTTNMPPDFDTVINTGDVVQLARAMGGTDVITIRDTLSCPPWDPDSGTGGILAIVAGKKIILEVNGMLNVTGKGFRGGDPNYPTIDTFKNNCNAVVDSFLLDTANAYSGRKGENIVYEGYPYIRGRLYNTIGGGAGNGKYSGGGGGANYGPGGRGGYVSKSCSSVELQMGVGGCTLVNFYTNILTWKNRLFLGGGGGCGTQNPDSGRYATRAGNGGGIIILITDTIESKGGLHRIIANGESVKDTATAGAGGGGGGGVIVLSANQYKGNLKLEVNGGNGGWTNHPDPTGPGGSGGGGVIWYSLGMLPGNVTVQFENGTTGQHIVEKQYGTLSPIEKGTVKNNLQIPLRGFLFNVMPYDQIICDGDTPQPLIASQPRGGEGPGSYTFKWQESTNGTLWNDALGVNTAKDYIPGPLWDTIFYRRIVQSGTVIDTSGRMAIYVLPVLRDNLIGDPDTVCKGSPTSFPLYNIPPIVSGGAGPASYSYIWQYSIDSTTWLKGAGLSTQVTYVPPSVDTTTWYRRVVISYACRDTSMPIKMDILERIHGNLVASNDTICEDGNTLPLNSSATLSGGLESDKRFEWLISSDDTVYNTTGILTENFNPGVLVSTKYYRRIVFSGLQNECIDTSNAVTILVHPHIANNFINRDSIICSNDLDLRLTQGTASLGGGNGIYTFKWELQPQDGAWQEAGGEDTMIYYEPGFLGDTTRFRRLVYSGVCAEYGNDIEIKVQDSLVNNLILSDDTICFGFFPHDSFRGRAGQVTGGEGPGTESYQWEYRLNSTNWTILPGAADSVFFPSEPLTDTTYYRRYVQSGKCMDYSDTVQIIVQGLITNNLIKNGPDDETCYGTTIGLDGTAGLTEMHGGNKAAYAYQWQKSADNLIWVNAPGSSDQEDLNTDTLFSPAYFRRWVYSGECIDSSAPVSITINPRPTGEISSDAHGFICYDRSGDSIDITVRLQLTGAPPFDVICWDGKSAINLPGFSSTDSSFIRSLGTDDSTDFVFVFTGIIDDNGCIAYTDSFSGLIPVSLFRLPETKIIKDGDTMQVCNNLVTLESDPDIGKGLWMPIAGDDNLVIASPADPVTQATTTFNGKNYQYYRISRIEQNWPISGENKCTSRDSVEIMLWNEPDPAYAGSKPDEEYDTIVFFADHINLFADPPSAGDGLWTLLSGQAVIENDTLFNTFVDLGDKNLSTEVEFLLRWEITNGVCPVTEDELRILRRDLKIYEGFSPDGNYINDYFILEGLDYADTYDLKIYSRSGNLIRKFTKGIGDEGIRGDQLWDGTYDGGRLVETGIYYYTLEVTKAGDPYQYKGFVVITRGTE